MESQIKQKHIEPLTTDNFECLRVIHNGNFEFRALLTHMGINEAHSLQSHLRNINSQQRNQSAFKLIHSKHQNRQKVYRIQNTNIHIKTTSNQHQGAPQKQKILR